ncbi:MAG: polymer-forming cytoskeletal protein [Planctomycetota bacterium]|nr:polymer-forming cytoskeletal protein [Planctomycetota bacterium]
MVSIPGKSDEYPTVIGADARFNGELSFEGSVRIDGSFEGAILTPGKVYVSQSGKVKAEIHAGHVTIDGSVEGNITSEGRLELNATCRLKGDVRAAKMQMAEGATWSGRCDVGPDAAKSAPEPKTEVLRQITDAASGKK